MKFGHWTFDDYSVGLDFYSGFATDVVSEEKVSFCSNGSVHDNCVNCVKFLIL